MATTTAPLRDLQNQALSAVRASQQAVVDAVQAWAGTVGQVSGREAAAGNSVADQVPAPRELIDLTFDFCEQLLATQREFASGILSATAPVFQATRQWTDQANGRAATSTSQARPATKGNPA